MTERTCLSCGTDISDTHPLRRYCSQGCSWTARPRIPCSECGAPSGWPQGRAGVDPSSVRCRTCRSDARGQRPTECAHCGDAFESIQVRDSWTRYCSKSCRGKADFAAGRLKSLKVSDRIGRDPEKLRVNGEKSRRRRRARLAEAESEPYTLAEIAERDGFRCGICYREVDMALKYPHPRSASVDHIIPLSKGGSDLKSNVRLAHLGENVARGNRTEWEQELLIG